MLYDNCKLLDTNGNLLALIDDKRAEWYARKGLGTIEEGTPRTVRLNFDPLKKTALEDNFHLVAKENKCVVCGTSANLTRHHVIPQSFRKHFELRFKSRASHDVLALCRKCHDEYNVFEVEFRRVLSERYKIPSFEPASPETRELRKLSSGARALLSGARIPRKREDELLELIIDHLGYWPEKEDLERLAYSFTPYVSMGCKTISQYIVSGLSPAELNELAKEWRAHFVETMNPAFLPVGWSVNRNFSEEE